MSLRDFTLADLVQGLHWNDKNSFTEIVLPTEYAKFLNRVYRDFLQNAEQSKMEGIEELSLLDQRLAAETKNRLLHSPVVSAVLRELENQKFPDFFMKEAVVAFKEWLAIELNEIEGEAAWSGFRITKDLAKHPSLFLRQKIPLDFDFPFAWEHLDVGVSKMTNASENNRLQLQAKIEAALIYMEEVSPLAAEFMLSHTYVILVRVAEEEGHSSSSSNLLRNGATMLRNIHLEDCSVEILAEFLLHEAIHHCLYQFEIVCKPFYCRLRNRREPSNAVKSPWSGNRISADSFLQACFVWFGLWNFWKMAPVNSRLDICSFGFLKPQSLSKLTEPAGFSCPDFLSTAINTMQSVVMEQEGRPQC